MKEICFCQTFFNSFVSHIYNLYKDTFLETYFKTGFYPFWKHILKWWTKQPPSVLGDENRIFMKILNYIYINNTRTHTQVKQKKRVLTLFIFRVGKTHAGNFIHPLWCVWVAPSQPGVGVWAHVISVWFFLHYQMSKLYL